MHFCISYKYLLMKNTSREICHYKHILRRDIYLQVHYQVLQHIVSAVKVKDHKINKNINDNFNTCLIDLRRNLIFVKSGFNFTPKR